MKILIKTKEHTGLPKIIDKGDWIDLTSEDDVTLCAPRTVSTEYGEKVEFNDRMIDLGVAMKLPEGFEAHVLPRSSLFKKKGVMLANGMGMIDCTYQGNTDFWKFHAVPFRYSVIERGERIAQFRIELSQKATFLQKLRWMLSSKIELVQVDTLPGKDRGGIGTTGGMK